MQETKTLKGREATASAVGFNWSKKKKKERKFASTRRAWSPQKCFPSTADVSFPRGSRGVQRTSSDRLIATLAEKVTFSAVQKVTRGAAFPPHWGSLSAQSTRPPRNINPLLFSVVLFFFTSWGLIVVGFLRRIRRLLPSGSANECTSVFVQCFYCICLRIGGQPYMAIGIDTAVKILSSFPTSVVPAALIRNVNKVYLFQKMHRGALEPPDTMTKQSQAIKKKSLKVIYCDFEWIMKLSREKNKKKSHSANLFFFLRHNLEVTLTTK